jgi:ADP-ribose pyrophosphatase YjhB (NUDIX family)
MSTTASVLAGTGVLIFSKDTDNCLFILRSNYVPAPNIWNLPGGKVNPNEALIDAGRREVMEEISYDLNNHELKLIQVNKIFAPRFVFYTFAAVVEIEFRPILNWESSAFSWSALEDAPSPRHTGLDVLLNSKDAIHRAKQFFQEQKSS